MNARHVPRPRLGIVGITPEQAAARLALAERALRLWPERLDFAERNRAEWLRAVAVVRGTARGWMLDRQQGRVA
jgi:hypothetical protein